MEKKGRGRPKGSKNKPNNGEETNNLQESNLRVSGNFN